MNSVYVGVAVVVVAASVLLSLLHLIALNLMHILCCMVAHHSSSCLLVADAATTPLPFMVHPSIHSSGWLLGYFMHHANIASGAQCHFVS